MPTTTVLMGVLLGIAAIGMLAGPIIGGGLSQHVNWRWCLSSSILSAGRF